jgi:menaquinone-dependent protoporphyrinogen oxidase
MWAWSGGGKIVAMSKILVVYATRQGGTEEVAATVADVLRSGGAEVDLLTVEDSPELAAYDAVVLGVPLYMGRFLKAGRRFMRDNAAALGERPLALFVLGPRGDEKSRASAQQQLDRALGKSGLPKPQSIAMFDGEIRPDRLRFPFNRMPEGDWRDWDAVREWAKGLLGQLSGASAPAVSPRSAQ